MAKINKNNSLLVSLKPIFKALSRLSMQNNKRAAKATTDQREQYIVQDLTMLMNEGFLLKDIKNIKQKHFEFLLKAWIKKKYNAKTIQQRINYFSLVFKLIGKQGLEVTTVNENPIPEELESIGHSSIKIPHMTQDDYRRKIANLKYKNKLIAMHAELMLAFGLSKKESLMIKPVISHRMNCLVVTLGATKGKERIIEIENDYQENVIHRAKLLVNEKAISLKPENITYKHWLNRFDYLCKSFHIVPSQLSKFHLSKADA